MSGRAGWQALGLVIGLTSASFGQGGGRGFGQAGMMLQDFGNAGAESGKALKVAVRITADDGKMVKGHLRLTAAVVASSLGVYEIKPEKVREIRFANKEENDSAQIMIGNGGAQKTGSIVTVGGEVIEGEVLIPGWWRVETELGTLRPNPQAVKSISFFKEEGGPAEDRLEPIPAPGNLAPPPQPSIPPGAVQTRLIAPSPTPPSRPAS